ncbi:MAG: RNA-binding transcriptional accessory protein [Tepidimonas sp.]|nr:RNA-binding transcriptional accessory protein [Tepidimonas sp.]
MTIVERIAQELGVHARQVQAAADLLDGGATVPFIARYRKEATGGLTDTQLRQLEERLRYLRELQQRREAILRSIEEQGKLSAELRAAIEAAATKQDLEDLYLPYRPKRRTKGQIAREAGLEPLADALWADPTLDPHVVAQAYVQPAAREEGGDFTTTAAVLDGARDILSERWAEAAAIVQPLREWLWEHGLLRSRRIEARNPDDPEVAKFRDYFEHDEPIGRVPSHRALAMLRGRAQEVLDVRLAQPQEPLPGQPSEAEQRLARLLGWQHQGRAADDWLRRCIAWTWRVKLALAVERDLLSRLRERAEAVAIQVFGANLRDLLLAAPAGPRPTMGLDPGIRTGIKVAVVDATGKVVEATTVYPFEPRRDVEGTLAALAALVQRHRVELIAIGNGTASRETDRLVAELLQRLRQAGQAPLPHKVVISEAGASVYSASELAAQELPQLDVSLRGAVSIARRLQDPLAELVKIDPKSIGVGQYQHDVDQTQLARTLDAVVEDCVNAVGVDLNTASPALLARVSGLSAATARAMVHWREAHGPFRHRRQLLEVTGIGPKTFEQCAGFLRIRDGDEPLDMTGVHPEAYPVVQRILADLGQPIQAVLGRRELLQRLNPGRYADARFGEPTVRDILAELEKPGRDPRPEFRVARFDEAVQDLADLKPGMVLEGTVTNVAQFGAFVDIGVHQDGLVHVSQLARHYVADARSVVKVGDVVRVKVLEVDAARRRIALSLRLDETIGVAQADPGRTRRSPRATAASSPAPTALAAAFARLQAQPRSSPGR